MKMAEYRASYKLINLQAVLFDAFICKRQASPSHPEADLKDPLSYSVMTEEKISADNEIRAASSLATFSTPGTAALIFICRHSCCMK